jgi:hypothetical protein
MGNKSYKEALLKSGIPLEYEVFKALEANGLITDFEYSYLKSDENLIQKEFSYDLSASMVSLQDSLNFTELMIECKYKVNDTNWLFIPEKWGGPHEIYPLDFIHVCDYFSKEKSKLMNDYHYPKFAMPCNKGVEIYGNGNTNEKTIVQAVSQLSYAFAEHITNSFEHQIFELMGKHETVFNIIPIIVTNANLYRLKPDTMISNIKKSVDISDIAEKEDFLMYKVNRSVKLEELNYQIITDFLAQLSDNKIKERFNTFTNNLNHFAQVLSKYPRSILILHWDEERQNLGKLIEYIKSAINPSLEVFQMLAKKQNESFLSIDAALKKHKQKGKTIK